MGAGQPAASMGRDVLDFLTSWIEANGKGFAIPLSCR